jgi:hypothetical protein
MTIHVTLLKLKFVKTINVYLLYRRIFSLIVFHNSSNELKVKMHLKKAAELRFFSSVAKLSCSTFILKIL